MKHFIPALLLCACATSPTWADETPPIQEGLNHLGEGSRLLLEGLMEEISPLIEGLEDLSSDLDPILDTLRKDLGAAFEGLNAYHPPEVLDNGDILLRRKTPAPEAPQLLEKPDDIIEL